MLKLIIASVLLFNICYAANQGIVVIKTDTIEGTVTFTKDGDHVKVEGTITGLAPGKHGFHIHDKGNLGNNCLDAAGHFNPTNKQHGGPDDVERHVGDLGNIISDENKVANISITDKLIALGGPNCIIGRALVIHSGEDDLGRGGFSDSKTTGHAGGRVACGVVGIAEGDGCGGSNSSVFKTVDIFTFCIIMILSFTINRFS